MPLFHVQNNALSKPRNCPHCGQLCVNRRNKSADSFSCYTLAVAKSCVSMQKFCMLNLGINTRLGDDIIVSCRQRTASFLLAVYPL